VAWCGEFELFVQSRTSLSIESSGDATGRADAGRWLRQGAAFAANCEGACHASDVPDALPAIYANEAAAAATVLANTDPRRLRRVSGIDFAISRYHARRVSNVMASREFRSHRTTVASMPPMHAIDWVVR
jgi:hypothetical protein